MMSGHGANLVFINKKIRIGNSTVFVIIKRINKVFYFFKRLLFRERKFKQQRNFQSTRWNRQWVIFSWYNKTIYKTTFFLDKILNTTRNFFRDMSHRFPRVKKLIFRMDRTCVRIKVLWKFVYFWINSHSVSFLNIIPSCFFKNMKSTGSSFFDQRLFG